MKREGKKQRNSEKQFHLFLFLNMAMDTLDFHKTA